MTNQTYLKSYPHWIDEYARAFYSIMSKCVPGEWGPVDYYAVWDLLNGLFIERVHEAIKRIKKQTFPIGKAAKTFYSPSQIRLAVNYLLMEYVLAEPKNKQACKEVVEYLVEILSFIMKEDTFAYERNIAHSQKEIKRVIEETKWKTGSPQAAQALGKLYTTLFSMAYAVHGEFYPMNSIEVYGPYDASSRFGNNAILLRKHFAVAVETFRSEEGKEIAKEYRTIFDYRKPQAWKAYPEEDERNRHIRSLQREFSEKLRRLISKNMKGKIGIEDAKINGLVDSLVFRG